MGWLQNSYGHIYKSLKCTNDKFKTRLPIHRGLLELILFEIQRYYGATQPYLETMYLCLIAIGIMDYLE